MDHVESLDASEVRMVAPSFGMGNWDKAGGAEFVVDVAREVLATLPIDSKRLYLVGYSNGAMGVTRAAIKRPELFKGLIYISPVTEDQLFSTHEFLSHYRNREILFIHGSNDRRIPRELVEGTVATLKGFKCDVRLKVHDGEDHYLLLSRPDAVTDDIAEYLTAK